MTQGKIRFHVRPFNLKESTKRNEAVLRAMSQLCGWGSWLMRLHASKCTECLPKFWESCVWPKTKRLKMTLRSQTPLIRKPLRRAYTTIRTLDRIKENQGILRTSQRVELGATRSNRPGTPPLLMRTQPGLAEEPPRHSNSEPALSMDPSELPQTSDCVSPFNIFKSI